MDVGPKEDNKAKVPKKIKKRKKQNKKQRNKQELDTETSKNFRATGKTPFVLLKLRVEAPKGPLTPEILSNAVSAAIQTMYGIVGGGILRYNWVSLGRTGVEKTCVKIDRDDKTSSGIAMNIAEGDAILRAAAHHYRRIWAAVTMMSQVNNGSVRISVIETCDESQNSFD